MAEPVPFHADDLYSWIIEKQSKLGGQQSFKRFILAYSGGLDSTALVLAMHQIKNKLTAPLLVVHVNHGIHSDAGRWAEACNSLCKQLDLPFQLLQAELSNASRKGLEARAREARYSALSNIAQSGDLLLTGQHADDQAETLLLHLMRGSGVEGLAAIHPCAPGTRLGWADRCSISGAGNCRIMLQEKMATGSRILLTRIFLCAVTSCVTRYCPC